MSISKSWLFSVLLGAMVPGIAFAQNPSRSQPPAANASSAGALTYLQNQHASVERLLRTRAAQRNPAEVTRSINQLLDFEELARQALGNHWQARTEAERREFVSLLQQLVERNYRENLNRTLDFNVRYVAEERHGESVVVKTQARSRTRRRAPEIAIDYTMRRVGPGWKVHDITTDGVSLVRNYRSQFGRIINQHGWAELVRRMRTKLEGGNEF